MEDVVPGGVDAVRCAGAVVGTLVLELEFAVDMDAEEGLGCAEEEALFGWLIIKDDTGFVSCVCLLVGGAAFGGCIGPLTDVVASFDMLELVASELEVFMSFDEATLDVSPLLTCFILSRSSSSLPKNDPDMSLLCSSFALALSWVLARPPVDNEDEVAGIVLFGLGFGDSGKPKSSPVADIDEKASSPRL